MKQVAYIALLLLFWAPLGYSQDTVDQATYEQLKADYDFDKTKEVSRLKSWDIDEEAEDVEGPSMPELSALAGLIRMLGYLMLLVLVLAIIYVLIKNRPQNKRIKPGEIDLDNLQEIKDVNFQKLLDEALAAQDYRLATRIRFLMVIQSLTERDLLKWKPYKTNRAYTAELSGSPLQPPFRVLARIFENVWYGMSAVSASEYADIDRQFVQLNQSLSHES